TSDINRTYNEVKNRNITNDAITQVFFNKTFNFNRSYTLRYDLSKNIKFDFTANNDARVMEPQGRIDTREEKDSVRQNIVGLGQTTGYRHAANMNWNIPINKIPILDFITATYKYGSTYTWHRRPFAVDTMGNTVQNTNSNAWNGQFNMLNLYNKIPYFKKINQKTANAGKTNPIKPIVKPVLNPKDTTKKVAPKDTTKKKDNLLMEYIARLIMTVKTVSVSYNATNGTILPGFNPSSRIMGMDFGDAHLAPGLPFVFGNQSDIRYQAAQNGWLAPRNNIVNQYTKTHTENFTARATLEPLPDLKIELNANKTYSNNHTSYITYQPDNQSNNDNFGFNFEGTPNTTGAFSMSTITFGSAFKNDDKFSHSNSVFNDFRLTQRTKYAEILSNQNANSNGQLNPNPDGTVDFEGYSREQQDVLVYAFIAAYTNRGGEKTVAKDSKTSRPMLTSSLPMPNWTVKYDGFGKIKALKKTFKGISISHAYRSTMNMNAFTNNLLYGEANGGAVVKNPGNNKNYVARYNIPTVTISESFSPLIKVDLQFVKPGWSGNFEIKKDRTLSLSTGNQIVSEIKGNELVVGAGYVVKDLTIKKIKVKGKPLKSDLKLKVDLSVRKNSTIQRRILDGLNTPTAGQRIITLRTSAEYQVLQNMSIRFFFDRTMNKPLVSSTFPTSNTNAGISIRFTLGS
ncbi:MAG: cell surface protein SprA, partial [Bacteroidia bacterium]|nr:cell surface protein SprA [Bacteroidia bacterium]